MVWGKAGSTTLSSAGDDVDITSLSESKTKMIISQMINSGACQNKMTFNDTGSSKYASRNEYNDDADSTHINQNFIPHWDGNDNASNPQFVVSFLCDVDGEAKIGMYFGMDRGTAGAGNTIRSRNMVYKYVNTPKITRMDLNNQGAGSYDIGSNLTVLGSDVTTAAAVPAIDDVQDNSLFIDKVNARRYWFDAGTDSTSINWNGADDCDVTATSIKKKSSAGNDWDVKAYTTEKCFSGGTITTTFKSNEISSSNTGWWLSFGTDAPSTGYGSDPAWFLRSDGKAGITTSDGNEEGSGHTITTSSVLKMVYTFGTGASTGECKWYIDDVLKHTESSITNPAHKTLNFSSYIADKGVNTLTLTVIGQDTWNMQPTKQFDFSSSTGWTTVGSNITITGGAISASAMVTQTDNRIYYDLGSALSDKFVIDFDHYADSSPANSFWQMFALTDTTAIPRTDDGIYPLIDMGSWDTYLRYSNEGSETNVGTLGSLTTGQWQYVRFVRDGTTGTLTVYSDSARTAQVLNVSGTIPATVTGLRYFQSGALASANTGTATYKIDNLKIYDGVTSIN